MEILSLIINIFVFECYIIASGSDFVPLMRQIIFRSLVIGNLSQPHDHLLDNVQEAIARLFDSCPGGLLNVRSLYLQIVTGGPTIPIYADTGNILPTLSIISLQL